MRCFLHDTIGLIVALLFSAMSALAMPMAPTAPHQTEFHPHQHAVVAEHTNVHFAARAPPKATANIGFTGVAAAGYGDGFAALGHENHVASLGFGVGLDAPNGGSGYPKLARPNANSQGNVILGDLDDLGRPTGVTSTITSDMIGTGSSASSTIRPPGFAGGANNHSRGHLLANILGGSGTDARNLVTLFQRHANSPNMRHFETRVRNAVDGGQVVNFRAIPVYNGNNPVPVGVTMTARGSGGFDLDVSIQNINGLAQ